MIGERGESRSSPAGGRSGPGTPAAAARSSAQWARFYARPAVRERIEEFVGGPPLAAATACFVTRPSPWREGAYRCHPTAALWDCLAADPELSRSLWDRRSLVVDIDFEHVHFDRPWAPLRSPARSRGLLRPAIGALEEILAGHGVPALQVLTGRGRHVLWRVARDSRAFASLARLGKPQEAPSVARSGPGGERVEPELAAAWNGLGKVMERLAHRILERAASATAIPVELTAVEVGGEVGHREIVSIDLSAHGDPLERRSVRIPFTAYLKRLGSESRRHPKPAGPRVAVPVGGDEETAALALRDLRRAVGWARKAVCAIPNGSAGTEKLIEEYAASSLAEFHRSFEAERPHPPERWPETYDRLDLETLPACAARILAEPNDLLLRPAGIQLVVRSLLALGWRPRHVAGLIRSKFERPYGWRADLHFHDARLRAEFYTRLFAGLVGVGRDRLIDFNCKSNQEKGLCPAGGCPWNLATLRDRLAEEGVDA